MRPIPRTDDIFSSAAWAAAEAAQAAALARVAMAFGALDERLRAAGVAAQGQVGQSRAGQSQQGLALRLALTEASDLSWRAGDRVSPDRLALWHGLHLAGVQDDAQALTRAGWALRRLAGGAGPGDPAAFLGRPAAALADWQAVMDAGAALHPFTRAAMGFALWRRGRDDAAGLIEAAVLAARLAATETRGGALFLPLAQGGGAGLQGGGSAADRLARWLAGAGSACAAALLQLDRVQAWQAGAAAAVADLSGRTPARLIGVLAAWPVVSAPLAAAQTATARATVQRNLTLFTARGLLREITGQGRYRLWTAKV